MSSAYRVTDLKQLKESLQQRFDSEDIMQIHMVGRLSVALNVPLIGKAAKFFTDTWPNFSVVVSSPMHNCVLEFDQYAFVAYDYNALHQLLNNPDVIDWSRKIRFAGTTLTSDNLNTLEEIAQVKGGKIDVSLQIIPFLLPVDSDEMPIPDGLCCSELKLTDAALVVENWPYIDADSTEYIKFCITNLKSVCLRTSHGKCVAYASLREFGTCGQLWVSPDWRRRGCARYILYHLIKKVAYLGINPIVCYVEANNYDSIKMFEKFGARKFEDQKVSWILFEPVDLYNKEK